MLLLFLFLYQKLFLLGDSILFLFLAEGSN